MMSRSQPTIVMTPPPPPHHQASQGTFVHPRRTPAERSVSLLHSPRHKNNAQSSDDSSSNESTQMCTTLAQKQDSDSPSSLNALAGKHSSGESSSNAEKWFERSNNESRGQNVGYVNNEAPYFLRNSSSSEEQAEGQQSLAPYMITDRSGSLPMRTGLLHLGTDGSSTEDFRSVIDDLTVENKKLKRRLKKYEKLHDSHLKDEKLFEVRIHGLPAEKKRELEETLRKFATDLHSSRTSVEFPSNGYVGLGSLLQTHKTASSSTSLQNADSAYASMSASGQGSSASDTRARPYAQSAMSRHQNIHTYLHHIPEGLLPSNNPSTMTEKAKKKLVVKRIEQLFAGTSAVGGHQQALQQQDVSHSAARADRMAREAQGQQSSSEGVREANIMHKPAEEKSIADDSEDKTSKKAMLEQRPTRPLDLDPHRAQIPAENMRYMRHLGFALPEGRSPMDEEGWVYLNLLVNMAQLHTANVTSDFVRKAIGEYSAKLELSSDGRKLRWKGGSSITRTDSTGGDSTIDHTDNDNSSQSPRKRIKLSRMDSERERSRRQKHGMASASQSQAENSRFAYTPLFFHKDSTGDEESSSDMDDDDALSSPFPQAIGGDSSGMTSSGVRTNSTKNKKKHDDGPIIFYNNARFCTDLSGDRKPGIAQGGPAYTTVSVRPIGMPGSNIINKYFEKRGPLTESELPEPMDLADNPIPASLELNFPAHSPTRQQHIIERNAPVNFEVTGIGGVYPADNFSIDVQSRHAIGPQGPKRKVVPPKLAKLLRPNDKSVPVSKAELLASRRLELQPSSLPPALSYMQNDSMSDEGSDLDDNMSISPESPGVMPRMAAPQPIDLPFSAAEDSDAHMDYDESDGESDDGSLDLLATARELDPEAVRAREREYDANMAERLAEEIPAGSSAATAGGGSGFASPASGTSKAAYQRAKKEARSHNRASLGRTQNSGSNIAISRRSTSASEDEPLGSVRS